MAVVMNTGRSLESTATWAVAVVCFVLIAISILVEKFFHVIESWLNKKRRSSLCEALEKIKTELMLLGLMSLLLSILQQYLSELCVPYNVGHSWHPCKEKSGKQYQDPCPKDKVQLVSAYGINQLHIFIFALAVSHIICSVTTLNLGGLKIKKWKSWEEETMTVNYQCNNDPERFRFVRETTFSRRHLRFWTKYPILLWIGCFFGQFFTSVAKVDYLTLRHGFITAHLNPTPQSQATFNFQKYINRSLEEDFKVLVGISPVVWLSAVLFLLTNTNGWYSQYWLPFIPLIIILLIGAKFQVIITKMGTSILERGDIVRGTPVVQLGDDLFWFSRPRVILFLIHFVLFQNAFQLAFFAWSWYEFGYPSCYHENLEEMLIRITMGVTIQVLCSYVTLPLYALVTQMGSSVKPVIFSQRVASALRTWRQRASKRLRQRRQSRGSTPADGGASPVHLLREHMKYNDIHKGREGGEGASASPSHRDIDYMMRKSRHLGKLKRNDTETSSQNFSFGNRPNLAGMDGSISAHPSHHYIEDMARNSISDRIEGSDTELSSQEFSFRDKPDPSGVSGSKW
ncbi:MLO-like protein 12 isoform X1 [Salvia hispanica]|uniref:MLO-like protein 12 isoform X1 n=1 Tax=Salvia hispanica TaxID=49212 RepID=UPI0020099EA7|nr:MLO-like protein 12 isoform X1 [Salvia hispanica]